MKALRNGEKEKTGEMEKKILSSGEKLASD